MEIIKKNIHMDRIKCKAVTQATLDDDINISDSKPDAMTIVLDKGEVNIEEIKPTTDHATVRGYLKFTVLYITDGDDHNLYCMEGKIPYEEQMYLEGAVSTDMVNVDWELEDLRVSLINSRKINVQAVVSFHANISELYDEETAVELSTEEPVEYRKKTVQLAEIAIQKKDIFRIKEEIEIPQSLPNIFQILWDSLSLGEVDFKPQDEKLSIQGEVNAFFLFEAEGDEAAAKWYETTIPFSGIVECHGCRENMLPNISYEIGHKEIEIRPDFDGEERIIGLDCVLDLDMKLYEEETVEVLADVYGVTKEVEAVTRKGAYKNILVCNTGKSKVVDKLKIKPSEARILQLCHSEGDVQVESAKAVENGIEIIGVVMVRTLYITNDDKIPFSSIKGTIPFQYVLDVPGISENSIYDVKACVEQLNVSMVDSEELEAKIILDFNAVVFSSQEEEIVADISVSELNLNKLNELPSIVAYIAREEDSLWQIGKKYYVPVHQIKEMNNLTSDEIKAGDKLLIVK